MIVTFYILNAMFLLLHEIESAYEKEWEILHLPGKISGFIGFHIPIILLMFYGLLEVNNQSNIGFIIALILGACGLLPFIVHRILVKKKDRFNSTISPLLIFGNVITGICLMILVLNEGWKV